MAQTRPARSGAVGTILAAASFWDWLEAGPRAGPTWSTPAKILFSPGPFATTIIPGWRRPRTHPNPPPRAASRTFRRGARRLDWRYPFHGDTELPAKGAVSDLRREMAGEEEEEEARPLFPRDTSSRPADGTLSAAEIGSAHHTFLERVALERAPTVRACGGSRTPAPGEPPLAPNSAPAWIWTPWPPSGGRAGCQLLDQAPALRRELAFTARLDAANWRAWARAAFASRRGEFVVVQGVVEPGSDSAREIWLLDFRRRTIFPAGN